MTTETAPLHAVQVDAVVRHWVIMVGGGYGAFLFKGTEDEAEEMRKHKAIWERAVGLKRRADDEEIKSGEASQCWNHENFPHIKKGVRYACDCCA